MNLEDVFTYDCLPRIGTYNSYWKSIAPTNNDSIFRRWLFAYTSIHTTWKSNVRAYNHIKNFEAWIDNKEKLSNALYNSRSGCHNIRTEYIWDFSRKYWNNPDEFKKQENETWKEMRNRLSLNLKGIGLAKTSFALEMCYPEEVEVVCLDVHMLRALNLRETGYRATSKKELSTYMYGEDVWLKKSKFFNSSPYILRCIFWDILQGEQSSRYWSSCFESQLTLEI